MSNKTIFQTINSVINPSNRTKITNKYVINDDIFTTTSKEEFETKKLQSHQNRYLSGLWKAVDNEVYQKSIGYETTRLSSYADFENMEYYPEIATALDVFSDEATTIVKGKMLNIYSNSKRIKEILEDLFYNRLSINVNLPMWCRNMCKYGDNFIYLNIDEKYGILNTRQLPTLEIERHENSLANLIEKGDVNKAETFFKWRGKQFDMLPFQIAHFRLLSDDRRLPYGTSLIEKARQIWKKLILAEDAMLVYRITRAPERRIFKVFVGNIDEEDVPAYIDEIANRFKRRPAIDPSTGQVDLRYNQLSNDQDYVIPVRSEDAPTPIETLNGATNTTDIADVEFLQNKLLTTLRVPKQFLGFSESAGNGKNLSLLDIRFARAVNRVQQSLLLELNKIAIIHLTALGFEDELDDFKLSLNNPSIQNDILQTELLSNKLSAYKDAVSDAGNGFAPMSMTRAKREILDMTDQEIIEDLLQQRLEKAAAEELKLTNQVIKNTGIYDKVDKLYGDINVARNGGVPDEANADGPSSTGGGGGGGFTDLSSLGAISDEELGGQTEPSQEETSQEGGDETPQESYNNSRNLLTEKISKYHEKNLIRYLNKSDNVVNKIKFLANSEKLLKELEKKI